jgi:hypothetical protein
MSKRRGRTTGENNAGRAPAPGVSLSEVSQMSACGVARELHKAVAEGVRDDGVVGLDKQLAVDRHLAVLGGHDDDRVVKHAGMAQAVVEGQQGVVNKLQGILEGGSGRGTLVATAAV